VRARPSATPSHHHSHHHHQQHQQHSNAIHQHATLPLGMPLQLPSFPLPLPMHWHHIHSHTAQLHQTQQQQQQQRMQQQMTMHSTVTNNSNSSGSSAPVQDGWQQQSSHPHGPQQPFASLTLPSQLPHHATQPQSLPLPSNTTFSAYPTINSVGGMGTGATTSGSAALVSTTAAVPNVASFHAQPNVTLTAASPLFTHPTNAYSHTAAAHSLSLAALAYPPTHPLSHSSTLPLALPPLAASIPTMHVSSALMQTVQVQQQQYQAAAAAAATATAAHAHSAAMMQQQKIMAEASTMTMDEKNATITRLLAEGESLRARNMHAEAIIKYSSILILDPHHVRALNWKGTSHKALRQTSLATECYQRALSISPADWISHNNLAIILKEQDRYDEAIQHYHKAIEHGPPGCVANENMSVVKTDLGTRQKLTGATDAAINSYLEALAVNPSYWPAYFNLGVIYSERGDMDQALRYYELALSKNATYVEALCNIGVLFKNGGQLAQAIEYYQRALKINPSFTIAANNLAIALTDMGTQVKNEGRTEEGIAYYKQALHWNSRYAAAWYNLGVAYAERPRPDPSAEVLRLGDAKVCYEMAILLDPNCAEAHNNLGVLAKDRGNLDQAMAHYHQALQANPNFSQTLNNLAVITTMLGKLDEAYDYCIRAIKSNPLYAEAHNNLGVLYRDEGMIEAAIKAYEDCLRIDPLSRNAGQNRLLALNSISRSHLTEQQHADLIWEAHRSWGMQFEQQYAADRYTMWMNPKTLDRPLRIGFISADFFTHSVSYFIEAPLRYADKSKTFVVCYSNVARSDKKTQLLQSYAHAWRSIHDKNTKEVCEMIRADGIDILVELTGHTAGNRLDVMAMKPAPVQVTWIGYPNSTGLKQIDYRITDDVVDPVDTPQQYSERLVRLPSTAFLCYTPPTDAPPVAPTPALHRGYVTFGSFNNLAKMNDRVLDCWCAILKQLPTSRMLIKCKPFACSTVTAKVLAQFAARGIDTSRIDLIPLLPTTAEHLATYNNIDISVDTFPYAGTTTTCEALYMGVPVVTYQRLTNNNHAHNVGGTLIRRIPGAESLITHSEQEYVKTAVSLASDFARLQQLRQNMRPAMLNSPLCDGPTFVKQLEGVYQTLWKRYCNQ